MAAAAAGWWWGKVRELRDAGLRDIDHELDAVAVDDEGRVMAVGSCKWTVGEVPYAERERLEALAAHLTRLGDASPDLYLFARAGFDQRLHARAAKDSRLHLVTAGELLTESD